MGAWTETYKHKKGMETITTNIADLRKKSASTNAGECRKEKIFERLEEALDKAGKNAAGLAAIQIGIPLRAAVIEPRGKRLRLINPRIIRYGPEGAFPQEGCLSLPARLSIRGGING